MEKVELELACEEFMETAQTEEKGGCPGVRVESRAIKTKALLRDDELLAVGLGMRMFILLSQIKNL